MAGLPTKFAKMGFKKGWKAFRASRHAISGGKKRGKVKHAFFLDGNDVSVPGLIQRPVKRLSAITPGKIFSPLIDLALIIAGMAAGAGVKKISPIKNPHLMNGTGAIIGVGGSLLTRNRFVKLPLLGVALQAAISEVKILMPNMIPIAGDDEVVYLPAGEEDEQIEYRGSDNDERTGAVVDGDNDERTGAVVDGEDEETAGEGRDA